jgi:DNA polymerase-1
MIEAIKQSDIIIIDTETNAEDIRDGRGYGTGISIACSPNDSDVIFAEYYPYRHVTLDGRSYGENLSGEDRDRLKSCIEKYTGYIVFHNAKFDLCSLSTMDINYQGNFYCTLLMAHLINENYPYSKSLNACVAAYVDKNEAKKEEELEKAVTAFGWAKVPFEIMRPYAIYDAVLTLKLYKALKKYFDEENLGTYWKHKQEFIRTIIAMESRGIKVDVSLCKELTEIGTSVLADLTYELGGNPGSSIFLKKILIDDLKLPVVKRSTKTNAPSFDKEAMTIYDEILEHRDNPTANLIKQYRGWQKSVTSNYLPYVELLSLDGRLRPNYKLHGTKTGRMSCEKPNLQQIPRVSDKPWNGKMKAAFIPEDGFELWEFDYSQLELRLGTAYAKEETLKRVFADDRDIFSEMATTIGMSRQDTKTLVYTTQYGGGISRISHVFGVSEARAAELRQQYFDSYPGFAIIGRYASNTCKQKGKIRLWSGRYRHFQSKKDDAHKAFNSVIQGGAADIVEHIMVRLHEEVDDSAKCRMLLQVHDSVVFEIRKDCVEEYKEKILSIMSDIKPDFGVKFAVDAHRWGE